MSAVDCCPNALLALIAHVSSASAQEKHEFAKQKLDIRFAMKECEQKGMAKRHEVFVEDSAIL